jgi:peptidyl-prolyl cis-trans isomerase SurA
MTSKFIYSLLFLLPFTLSAQGTVIDKIVAQIGDNIILLSDIQAQKLQMIQAELEITDDSECALLEQMMHQNLLLNQAKLDSVMVPDAQVDAEMENRIRVIEQQIGGRQKLEAFYGKSVTQIKEEFRELIRDRLLTQEMERTITQDVTVTPKEVKEFFKTIPEDSIPYINSRLSFQQIVFYPEITNEDKKRTYDKLEEIRKDIENGKSFSTMARIHSMDPGSKVDGGKMEASRGMMVPQFEATAFSLKEGEMSGVFETDYGYHILKLEERKGDDYVCRHILLMPEYSNAELEKAAFKIDSCYAALMEEKITWDEAVIKYSNDEKTMQNLGIITNPITGEQSWSMEDLNQVDQQIFVLTDALDVNEISQPNLYVDIYERKQGIRIVKLMKRTAPHVANLTQDYALIKRAAENAKKEMILDEWTQDKINQAYIKIDPSFAKCNYKNNWTSLNN